MGASRWMVPLNCTYHYNSRQNHLWCLAWHSQLDWQIVFCGLVADLTPIWLKPNLYGCNLRQWENNIFLFLFEPSSSFNIFNLLFILINTHLLMLFLLPLWTFTKSSIIDRNFYWILDTQIFSGFSPKSTTFFAFFSTTIKVVGLSHVGIN